MGPQISNGRSQTYKSNPQVSGRRRQEIARTTHHCRSRGIRSSAGPSKEFDSRTTSERYDLKCKGMQIAGSTDMRPA
eukprot:1204767-Pleurochrysis_carterae.AAC.1